MPDVHTLYIVRTAHEIKLCSHEGRISLIVPNYTEVFAEPIDTKDSSKHCYQIEVRADEVMEVPDGGVKKLLLWLGDPGARSRPQDMLTLPVTSLAPIGGGQSIAAPGAMNPQETAAALFAGYSEEVRLAGVIAGTTPETMAKLPTTTSTLSSWASSVLSGANKTAAAGAG